MCTGGVEGMCAPGVCVLGVLRGVCVYWEC